VTGPGRLRVALAVAATLAAPGAQARIELGAPAAEADVTIGCMFPMTGRSAIYGRDSVGGIRVALERLAQSTPGRAPRLRILVDDDRSKAAHAVQLARDYVRLDGARFICGVVSSGVAQAVSRIAAIEDVIFVGTDHASSRLTIEDLHRRYFRVSNDTFSSMAAGARYLADLRRRLYWKRLAFVGADYDHGHVSLQDLRTGLDQLGVKYDLVATVWPKLYEPDYSDAIRALQESRPDIVVTALWGGDFIAFLKQVAATDLLDTARLANFDTGGPRRAPAARADPLGPAPQQLARHRAQPMVRGDLPPARGALPHLRGRGGLQRDHRHRRGGQARRTTRQHRSAGQGAGGAAAGAARGPARLHLLDRPRDPPDRPGPGHRRGGAR
jgi:branched-chain amino acid transport system substrate-binding protein